MLLAVGDFERRFGKCGDFQSPHCSTMISQKTHTWVRNQIGHILCVSSVRSDRLQNCHFDNGNQALALFLGLKPKNEADFFLHCLINKHNNQINFGIAASAVA